MRHGDKINNLGRTASHRKALLSNLANALLVNKRIVTTLAKAKALRVFIEPLITKTKKNENKEQISHNHRLVFSALNNKEAVKELFTVIAPKVAGRPGGYTRIIKLGKRIGDNAETALIELVDFNEVYGKGTEKAATGTTKRTRRAGGSRKKAEAKEETATAETKPEETTIQEAAEEAKPE
ncbi:MAG: 50S ribosomal protein L17 [Chitinophagaceae bacterium]|nr:50S ribosomal protein L17 [Chitinophagaceae bacterium]